MDRCTMGADDIKKLSPADRDVEEAKLRAELDHILSSGRETSYHRTLSVHYLLGYIGWLKAGSPKPMPRFV